MKLSKRLISGMVAVVSAFTICCSPAFASTARPDNFEVANCRTYQPLKEKDKQFVLLKTSYINVSGKMTYAGKIWGALDYDIIGDDDVRCKVTSSAYKHYAICTTDKGNSVSDDINAGVAAYSKWVTLKGNNGDTGWANFAAGYYM